VVEPKKSLSDNYKRTHDTWFSPEVAGLDEESHTVEGVEFDEKGSPFVVDEQREMELIVPEGEDARDYFSTRETREVDANGDSLMRELPSRKLGVQYRGRYEKLQEGDNVVTSGTIENWLNLENSKAKPNTLAEGIDIIQFNEIHEMDVSIELVMGYVKLLIDSGLRPDLQAMYISATPDSNKLSALAGQDFEEVKLEEAKKIQPEVKFSTKPSYATKRADVENWYSESIVNKTKSIPEGTAMFFHTSSIAQINRLYGDLNRRPELDVRMYYSSGVREGSSESLFWMTSPITIDILIFRCLLWSNCIPVRWFWS
jgi:hypothetical protein